MEDKNDYSLSPAVYVLRNLSRRKLRTSLTIAGITISLAFFVVLSSLSAGMDMYLEEEINQSQVGFITMYAPPALTEKEMEVIEELALDGLEVQGYSGHMEVGVTMPLYREYGEGGFVYYSASHSLIGVPQEGLDQAWVTYDFSEPLVEGDHINEVGQMSRSVVLGHEIWKKLYPDIHVGDVIDLVPHNDTWNVLDLTNWTGELNSDDGYVAPMVFIPLIRNVTVVGILDRTGDHNLDGDAYLPLRFMQSEFMLHNPTTGQWFAQWYELIIEDAAGLDFNAIEFAIRDALPRIEGWDNREWLETEWAEEMRDTVNSWFFLVSVVIAMVTVLAVSNTMAMSVTERSREIGVLRAIGFRARHIKRLVYGEALILIGLALVLGLAIGAIVSYYFDVSFDESRMSDGPSIFFAPAHLGPDAILLACGIALVFSLVATAIPAGRATRLDLQEAIRGE